MLLSSANPSWHVFEEDHGGLTLGNDSEQVIERPVVAEAPVIAVALALAGSFGVYGLLRKRAPLPSL